MIFEVNFHVYIFEPSNFYDWKQNTFTRLCITAFSNCSACSIYSGKYRVSVSVRNPPWLFGSFGGHQHGVEPSDPSSVALGGQLLVLE